MADNNKVLLPVFPNARSVALPSLKITKLGIAWIP